MSKSPPIHHFHEVTPHLFRSAQPLLSQYEHLVQCNVRTVINLRGEVGQEAITMIEKHLREFNIEHLHIPLIDSPPHRSVIDQYLELVRQAEANKEAVLVHCAYGQDRTGFFIGTWRVLGQKWNYSSTYEEMLKYGFHPEFTEFTKALKGWAKD